MRSDVLPERLFSTDGIKAEEKHEAWRMQGWPSVAQICEFHADANFSAKTRTINIPHAVVISGFYGSQMVHRTPALIRRSPIDNLHITIPLEANVRGERGNACPGSAIVVDLAQEWKHRAEEGRMYTISIPRRIALERGIDPNSVHGAIINPSAATLLREHVKQVVDNARLIPFDNADRIADTITGLLAVALSIQSGGTMLKPKYQMPDLKKRALRLIDSSLLGPPLDPDELVVQLATSRATLYRLFEDEGGLQREIKRRRLLAAGRDLERGSKPIGLIGLDYGFSGAGHFSRSFKAEFDMTPKEWRNAAKVRE